MATGDPKPQTEQVRELIVTGNLKQLKGVMDVEVSLWRDRAFRELRHAYLALVGPVVQDTFLIWFLPSGSQADLLLFHDCNDEMMALRWRLHGISVSPGMTLQQIYDQALADHISLSYSLHLGLLHAIELPEDRLRLLFAVARFEHPPLFWRWVDDLTAELHRLGFSAAAPPGEPPPPADEPGSLESSQSGWLAGQGSRADQVAAGAKPWMKIDDVGWDRRALELWWRGYTVPEIADRLSKRPKTIGNRLSSLRRTYGPDIVPPVGRLRTLNIR